MNTVETQSNELIEVVNQSGLESQTGNYIKEQFLPFFEQAQQWKIKAAELVVTNVSQTREMQMARQARLALKDIRVNADKTRKALKEDSLRYGKAVQGVYNVIEFLIAPIEKHLEEQEKFAEIQEANRKAALKTEREIEVTPWQSFIPYGLDFGNMSDVDYNNLLNGAKLQQAAKIEAEQKAEGERIEREKQEAAEREAIRLENEKLKAEREAREAEIAAERAKAEAERLEAENKARIEKEAMERELEAERKRVESEKAEAEKKSRVEREAIEAKLKAEREAREKAEAEIKAKEAAALAEKQRVEAEAAAQLKAQQKAEKQAALAPDKTKLKAFAATLADIKFYPELKSEEAAAILAAAKTLLSKTVAYINEKAELL